MTTDVSNSRSGLDRARLRDDIAYLEPQLSYLAAIRDALPVFGKQIRGFDRADAVLTGVETRTSSPIRVQRGEEAKCGNKRRSIRKGGVSPQQGFGVDLEKSR